MQFAESNQFVWLWVVAGTCVFMLWYFNRYKGQLKKFADEKLLEEIVQGLHPRKHIYKALMIVCILFFSVIALARPQWGFEWKEIKREGMDILVVIDTSKSMLTQDVKPNRIERTKLAVKDLLKKLQGDRIGLMAFAGDAFMVCPLTTDYNGY